MSLRGGRSLPDEAVSRPETGLRDARIGDARIVHKNPSQ
jgi:hypothetical protein